MKPEKYADKQLKKFLKLAKAKYLKGHQEHIETGGLWNLSASRLIDELIGEAIDHVMYLMELRNKINKN